jgi:hypothetical protein
MTMQVEREEGGRGVETDKTTEKKCGPLEIYSLYTTHVSLGPIINGLTHSFHNSTLCTF